MDLNWNHEKDKKNLISLDIKLMYFNSISFTSSGLYFSTPYSQTYDYVENAFLSQYYSDSTLIYVVIQSDVALVHLYQTEDIAYLINYYKAYRPYKTLRQNYYNDTLQLALSNIGQFTAYRYAEELSDYFGIDLGLIESCGPNKIALLQSKFEIYGSSRLGQYDAKINRKQSSHVYARKLGAKSYELADHLGNVVATISDKKLHPQDLVVNGNSDIDTSLGFQADVTGRYDYYPFGMEIMSRSGDYSLVDYTTNTYKTEFEGLIKDCSNYDVKKGQMGDYTKECITNTNIYGQIYMDEFFVNQTENEYFRVEIFAPLSEIIPNLDTNGIYTIEVHIDNTQYRSCSAYFDGAIVQPLSQNGTTGGQIRSASDKYFEFVDYTGTAIQAMTVNGKLKLDIRFNKAVKTPYSSYLKIVKIKVIRKYPNTQVALAKRDEAAYTYGFNGMLRDDQISGSGNSYDFGARMYNPRIGRWFGPDPYEKLYAPISPYAFALNSPIKLKDADGNVVTDENGKPITISYSKNKDGSFSATFKLEDGSDVSKTFMENGGRVISTLIQVESGRDVIQKAIDSKNNINIEVSPESKVKKLSDGKTKRKLGTTFNTSETFDTEGNLISTDTKVKIYEGTINDINKNGNGSSVAEQEYSSNKLTQDQKVARTGAHELEHATNPVDNKARIERRTLTEQEHDVARDKGTKVSNEFGKNNKRK